MAHKSTHTDHGYFTLVVEKTSYEQLVSIYNEKSEYDTMHLTPQEATELALAILRVVAECTDFTD